MDKRNPAPDMYSQVLKTLRLDVAHCLSVEDSADDWRVARAAGIRAIVTRNAHPGIDGFSEAAVQNEDEDSDKPCISSGVESRNVIIALPKPIDRIARSRIHADAPARR